MKTYNKIYTVHAWKNNNKFFIVTQGEGGIKYPRLKIIDDNGSIDLTGASITYTVTLPRGSEEIIDVAIIDAKQGTVEFEVKSSMTICSGIAHGELNIVSDSKVLKVGGVNLTIISATNGHEIEASEQFSALVEALRKVVTLTPEGTAVIPDGNITTEKLADGAVTKAKLSSNLNTLAAYGISDAYTQEETNKKLARKLDSMPFDNEPKQNSPCYLTSGTVYNSLLTKADKTETDNLLVTKADKADVDMALTSKADLVNSSNIFDFDIWAKGLQGLTKPVAHGTLDKLNFDEKSITFTATEKDAYTNSWALPCPESMKISVKPNTKYWVYWLTNNYDCNTMVFLNGIATDGTFVTIKGGKGTFVTNNDTSFITIRFGSYNYGTFTVSEIMIAEKESIYLPITVAEGVPEVADEILAFEKTTQTSLDGKYDSSNIESGTSKLTPHSNVTDKIKSASCVYKTIGDIVIINATITMNAITMGANNTYPLIDLPYKCISDSNVFCVGITSNNKLFKFAVLKNNTWLQFQSQDKTAYTFADGEQINVICSYKIK